MARRWDAEIVEKWRILESGRWHPTFGLLCERFSLDAILREASLTHPLSALEPVWRIVGSVVSRWFRAGGR